MADWSASLLSGDALRAEDAERWARELEAEVQIEAAVPGWLQAVGLALA